MYARYIVRVGSGLSARTGLTRHDPLVFSSSNTQAGAYRISLTPLFAVRLQLVLTKAMAPWLGPPSLTPGSYVTRCRLSFQAPTITQSRFPA